MILTGQSLAVHDEPYLIAQLAAMTPPLDEFGSSGAGLPYVSLKKGTTYYQAVIDHVHGLPAPHVVKGIHIIHGEADQRDATTRAQYQADLNEWQSDYATDIDAITSQSTQPFLVICQVNSWPQYSATAATGPTIGLAQLDAHLANSKVHLIGPKYQLGYDTTDYIHLTAQGYARLAQLHRRALQRIIAGTFAGPLYPVSAVRSGTTVTVQFNVPEGNLALDTTLVSAQTNYGFQWKDDSNSASISSVTLGADHTSVVITLNTTPTGANPKVRYGFITQFGNLRDTSTDTYTDGAGMHNWCVHFSQAVT